MLEAITNYTTPGAVISFLAVIALGIYRLKQKNDRKMIESASEKDRADLVKLKLQTQFGISSEGISEEQKFALLKDLWSKRTKTIRIAIRYLVLIAIFFGLLEGFNSITNNSNNNTTPILEFVGKTYVSEDYEACQMTELVFKSDDMVMGKFSPDADLVPMTYHLDDDVISIEVPNNQYNVKLPFIIENANTLRLERGAEVCRLKPVD